MLLEQPFATGVAALLCLGDFTREQPEQLADDVAEPLHVSAVDELAALVDETVGGLLVLHFGAVFDEVVEETKPESGLIEEDFVLEVVDLFEFLAQSLGALLFDKFVGLLA